MSPLNPTFKPTGSREGNAPRIPKASHPSDKDLVKSLLTQLLHQGHGTINWSQWILIELGHQEEIGGGKDEVHREGT